MGKIKLFTIIAILLPNLAYSVNIPSQASVEIVGPLYFNQLQELNFGKVLVPDSGNHRVVVRRNGQYNANTTGTLGSFQNSALFRIYGTPNAVVNYTVLSINSTIPGVNFDRVIIPNSQTLNNNGQRNLRVGGRIFVDSTATPGVYNNGELSYTFMAEYE